ncbi:hypothetical protein DTO271G3_5528 [Paecilomyces variotii]|nr:hypothetical protein DTO271G3_5528 [Paecilomyces variotii]
MEPAIKEAGCIDVVSSNAVYSILKSVEDMSEEEHHQFSTNVYGPMRVIKALFHTCIRRSLVPSSTFVVSPASPVDLRQRSMYIRVEQVCPGRVSRKALQAEVAPFNIHVPLVEPGGFRTMKTS